MHNLLPFLQVKMQYKIRVFIGAILSSPGHKKAAGNRDACRLKKVIDLFAFYAVKTGRPLT